MKCQLCQHYRKDGYCEELELYPCYPQKGCDYFSEHFDLTPCDDAISRQAAIDAFQMFREYEFNRSNKEWVDRIETVLNQLPPVNPQESCTDAVSRQDAINANCYNCSIKANGGKCSKCDAVKAIEYLPPVTPY